LASNVGFDLGKLAAFLPQVSDEVLGAQLVQALLADEASFVEGLAPLLAHEFQEWRAQNPRGNKIAGVAPTSAHGALPLLSTLFSSFATCGSGIDICTHDRLLSSSLFENTPRHTLW
jgi:hypothetical protein